MERNDLICIRVKHASPHFVTMSYVGTKEKGKIIDATTLSDVYRLVEVVEQLKNAQGELVTVINMKVLEEQLMQPISIYDSEILAITDLERSKQPYVFELLEKVENERRLAAVGLVTPDDTPTKSELKLAKKIKNK